jgi:hypothetical protein
MSKVSVVLFCPQSVRFVPSKILSSSVSLIEEKTQKGEWRPYWEGLLRELRRGRAERLEGDHDGRPRALCCLDESS